jgi:hypothetical protein
MRRATDHSANARIYSAWARKEIALAERESDPYVQCDRLARAENYIGLAEMSCWPPCALLTQAARLRAGISETAIPAQDHAPSLSGLLRTGPY